MKNSTIRRVSASDLNRPRWTAKLSGAGDQFNGTPDEPAIIGQRVVRGTDAVDVVTGKPVVFAMPEGTEGAEFLRIGSHLLAVTNTDVRTTYRGLNPDDGSVRFTLSLAEDTPIRITDELILYWRGRTAKAINIVSGEEEWADDSQYNDEGVGYIEDLPVHSGLVAIPDESGTHAVAVDADSGYLRFQLPTGYEAGLAANGGVIAVSTDDSVVGLDAQTGRSRWHHAISSEDYTRILVIGHHILLADFQHGVRLSSIDL